MSMPLSGGMCPVKAQQVFDGMFCTCNHQDIKDIYRPVYKEPVYCMMLGKELSKLDRTCITGGINCTTQELPLNLILECLMSWWT